MEYSRTIKFFNNANVDIKYYEKHNSAKDNNISRYDDYKISIRLTDGLFAVLDTQIIGNEKGDVLLFAPDEIHFGKFSKAGLYRYIHLFVPVDFCDEICNTYPSLKKLFAKDCPQRTNCLRGNEKQKEKIINIGEAIVKKLKEETEDDFPLACDIIKLLLTCANISDNESGSPTNRISPYTQFAIEYINNHYPEKISTAEIAKKAGCSTVYLSKVFKKNTGKPIYTYLTEYRISKSTLLLKNGANVTEACYNVGFGDCSNFIRTFKKITGTSPLKYKKLTD